MYCKNCGSELNGNDKFCQYCGSAVKEEKVDVFFDTPTVETPATPQKLPYNGLAIAGFVVSLAAILIDFLLIASITGTVLSSVAMYQIKRVPKSGKGLAIAGLVVGIVAIVINFNLILNNYLITYA